MNTHWTDQDFLNHLYEIGPHDGHLGQCSECRARFEAFAAARRGVLAPPELPSVLLSEQRRRIHQRLESSRNRLSFRWTPALAAAAAVLLLALWRSPSPNPEAPVRIAQSDAQVMAEIYQTAYQSEPRAVEAIHGLFEEVRQ